MKGWERRDGSEGMTGGMEVKRWERRDGSEGMGEEGMEVKG